jgi:hypothetical protein
VVVEAAVLVPAPVLAAPAPALAAVDKHFILLNRDGQDKQDKNLFLYILLYTSRSSCLSLFVLFR